MKCQVTLLRIICGVFSLTIFLTLLSFFIMSFHRTDENTTCIQWNSWSGSVKSEPITEATFGVFGPYTEFECLNTTLEVLSFAPGQTGIYTPIVARTTSGINVTLTVDVEFRYQPEHVRQILIQSDQDGDGNIDPRRHFAVAARSDLRNAVSLFEAKDFLRGSRVAIAEQMKSLLQQSYNPLRGLVNRINLLEIQLDREFEDNFHAVEEKIIVQGIATEQANLARINQARLKEQEQIAALAQRDRTLQEAEIRLTQAQLNEIAQNTIETTETERMMILLESERNVALIQERAKVQEAESEQTLQIQETLRDRVRDLELAETARTRMQAEYDGLIKTANATREQDIIKANIEQQVMLETLRVLEINHDLNLYNTELSGNITAREIQQHGRIAAQNLVSSLKPIVDQNQGLIDRLGLTPEQATKIVWYATMANNTAALRFGDYTKVPLFLEGSSGSQVQTVLGVPTTP